MSSYFVSDRAKIDLIEIGLSIGKNNPKAADQIIEDIVAKFSLLAEFPHIGRSREELSLNLRSFPVGKYLVFFRPREGGVDIVRIIYGARDIPTIFEE